MLFSGPKPHLVLIPGAWHTSACYDKIIPKLKARGYHTTALSLPSVDADPALTNTDADVSHIRREVEKLVARGEEVVLVMHSYSGIPGTQATKSLSRSALARQNQSGGVIHLVYLTAMMVEEGKSLSESRPTPTSPEAASNVMTVEHGKATLHNSIEKFYHDIPPEEAQKYNSRLKTHSVATFMSPMTYAAYKEIPSTYLMCKNDRMITYGLQREMVEKAVAAGAQVDVVTCDAGHSPFLSQPDLVVRLIARAAEGVPN